MSSSNARLPSLGSLLARYGRVTAMAVVAVLAAGVTTIGVAASPLADALPVPAAPAIQECGARNSSDVELSPTASSVPSSPVDQKAFALGGESSGSAMLRLHTGSRDEWYARTSTGFSVYDASTNALVTSFQLPASLAAVGDQFDVGPDGDIYVLSGGTDIYKFDTTGAQVWTKHLGTSASDGTLFGYGNTASSFRIATVLRTGRVVGWDESGARRHVMQLPGAGGTTVTYDAETNRLLYADGDSASAYDVATGKRVFYIDGPDLGAIGVAQSSNGDFVVDTTTAFTEYQPDGIMLGRIGSDPGAHSTGAADFRRFDQSYDLVHYDGAFYTEFNADNQPSGYYVGSLSDSLVTFLVAQPQGAPFGLGAGATLDANGTADYIPYGTTPKITIDFGSWWSADASTLSGQYTVRDMKQILANDPGTPVTFSIPSGIPHGGVGTIDVDLPSTNPGYYEMDVRLKQSGRSVSADCLRYSIGAQGQSLGSDSEAFTGSGDAQGVALAAELGQKIYRSQYNLASFLPSDNPADAAPMDFSRIDPDVARAAAEAKADGVIYEMQLATGVSRDVGLVKTPGRWQARVTEWVKHFAGLGVHAYEAWNEPNSTYGNGTDFTNNVLKPFYAGVKAADRSATVIGGGVLGTDLGFFRQLVAAGGLNYVDAVGIHPYTGHNRSFEEQGILPALQAIQKLFADNGKPNLPLYATESGFWNTGPNQYYDQGDKLIRKDLLMRSIGMDWNANFFNAGDYTVDNNTWSLLGDQGLTAAGLASVVYKQALDGRRYLATVSTGVPHTYAMEFGPSATDPSDVVAVWADDYTVGVVPTLTGGGPIAATDEWGGTSSVDSGSHFTLTGSVSYLTVPAGHTLTLSPAESYGADLALASNGATAAASSQPVGYGSPSNVIDGITNTQNLGDDSDGVSLWAQNPGDKHPWLQVTLKQPEALDRVYVSSQGLGSVEDGLRSYDLQVEAATGGWVTVAHVSDEYFARNKLLTFPARQVAAMRLVNLTADFSGYGDGNPPTSWPSDFESKGDVWSGQTTVYEIEAFAPGTRAR